MGFEDPQSSICGSDPNIRSQADVELLLFLQRRLPNAVVLSDKGSLSSDIDKEGIHVTRVVLAAQDHQQGGKNGKFRMARLPR
jgi:hypothetical protein